MNRQSRSRRQRPPLGMHGDTPRGGEIGPERDRDTDYSPQLAVDVHYRTDRFRSMITLPAHLSGLHRLAVGTAHPCGSRHACCPPRDLAPTREFPRAADTYPRRVRCQPTGLSNDSGATAVLRHTEPSDGKVHVPGASVCQRGRFTLGVLVPALTLLVGAASAKRLRRVHPRVRSAGGQVSRGESERESVKPSTDAKPDTRYISDVPHRRAPRKILAYANAAATNGTARARVRPGAGAWARPGPRGTSRQDAHPTQNLPPRSLAHSAAGRMEVHRIEPATSARRKRPVNAAVSARTCRRMCVARRLPHYVAWYARRGEVREWDDLDTTVTPLEEQIAGLVFASGPVEGAGEETFSVTVCTPEALAETLSPRETVSSSDGTSYSSPRSTRSALRRRSAIAFVASMQARGLNSRESSAGLVTGSSRTTQKRVPNSRTWRSGLPPAHGADCACSQFT